LLGGASGYVLSKASATDMDFTWIPNDTGDITGVTAGTGITGGGTSGTVTVTNDMATTITAAGDIVVGTGSGTYDNLPIGTTAQVLTADTTVSPYKVKWATPAATEPVTFWAQQASNQSFTASTATKVTFGTELIDSDGYFASSRFTPLKAGYYSFGIGLSIEGGGQGINIAELYKNGAAESVVYRANTSELPAPGNVVIGASNMLYFNGTTDYAEVYIYSTRTSPSVGAGVVGGFNGFFVHT